MSTLTRIPNPVTKLSAPQRSKIIDSFRRNDLFKNLSPDSSIPSKATSLLGVLKDTFGSEFENAFKDLHTVVVNTPLPRMSSESVVGDTQSLPDNASTKSSIGSEDTPPSEIDLAWHKLTDVLSNKISDSLASLSTSVAS